MPAVQIKEINVLDADLQFMFPFQIITNGSKSLVNQLVSDGWEFFNLKNKQQEARFYGERQISNERMEKFFLPNIEPILYAKDIDEKKAFRRFSKAFNENAIFHSNYAEIEFKILSVDIIVCPFNVGMMTLRVVLPKDLEYSQVLHFIDLFRQLDVTEEMSITIANKNFIEVKDVIFSHLCSWLSHYLDDQENSSYFGSLPYFIDERMQVFSFLSFAEDKVLDDVTLYRAGQIKGLNEEGEPYAGAQSMDYIKKFCQKHVYDRWGDESYYVISDYAFSCLTNAKFEKAKLLSERMYGENYYTLLLFFFYRLVLLKLSYEYSQVDVKDGKGDIDRLIVRITNFSARYYQMEVHSRSFGKEIFNQMKSLFGLEDLYQNVKETLDSLYQIHEKLIRKRHEYLLTILTVYTVISGIYGMNLVISDWKGKIDWSKLASYTLFEYISYVIAVSGIFIGLVLGLTTFYQWIKEKWNRSND